MLLIEKINNEEYRITIGDKSRVYDSIDEIIEEEVNTIEIRLTETIFHTKETINQLLSSNWTDLISQNENYKVNFSASVFEKKLIPESIINWIEFNKIDDNCVIILHTYSLDEIPYFWKEKWSAKLYFDVVEKTSILFDRIQVEKEFTFSNDMNAYSLAFKINANSADSLQAGLEGAISILKLVHKKAKAEIKGFSWKPEYETNESVFSKDLLLPLFRKLGFKDVHYNHGIREYGKDFVFADTNKFGFEIYYAVQVKKGNIKGSVNSQIDELIGQIEDAFSMPFYGLNSKEPKYISTFIVAISGKFTENAKEKVINKISNRYGKIRGSIFFLDKEKLIELMS